jgi:peroxiredoxin
MLIHHNDPCVGYQTMAATLGHIRIGDKAPDFHAKSSTGDFHLYDYLGDSWGIFFSHPADYTPGAY